MYLPRLIRNSAVQAMALAGVALLLAATAAALRPATPASTPDLAEHEVLLETVLAWPDETLWLDARSAEAFGWGHVPEALPLSEDRWEEQLLAVLDTWRPGLRIVIYCDSDACDASHEVAERFRAETGIDDVYVLKNGWAAWQAYQRKQPDGSN